MARGKYKGPKRGSGQKNRGGVTEQEEEDAFRGRARALHPHVPALASSSGDA
jgi:hypothetical protein